MRQHEDYFSKSNSVSVQMQYFCAICSTSLPGGNQVDGLPPASSGTISDTNKDYMEFVKSGGNKVRLERCPGFGQYKFLMNSCPNSELRSDIQENQIFPVEVV